MSALTLEEIRVASGEKLAAERSESGAISETTPIAISPKIEAFCKSLSAELPRYVPVMPDESGLYGWCNTGVAEKVRVDGGKPVYGWTIWEWPHVLATAEFHCVWESQSGDLLDITPKPKDEKSILFVTDRSYAADFNFDNRPGNRRSNVYEGTSKAVIAAKRVKALTVSQLAYETRRATKANLSLQEWFEQKLPDDPRHAMIDELITTTNMHEAHFDTLGTDGTIQPDRKFFDLLKRRMATLQKVKAAFPNQR